jgi:hypothetical protein
VLKHSHFLVLDGPPEARKTTIAAALVLTHPVEGFEVIDIRHPTEVFKSYEPNRRQIFVADDAVGSVSLEPALADSWSRDLPGILGKLDTEHKLIWTTRRYILEEALAESRLADTIAHFPGTHDVLVEVGSLTTTEKAEILYNHAKNANLFAASKVLIRQKASTIVYHRNFTPERIRQLITIVLAPPDGHQGSRSNVWDDIADFLSNPTTRWIQAYRKLSNSEQTLLSAMLDFAYNACSVDLKASYTRRSARIVGGQLQFDECCSRLQHSFLSTSIAFNGEHLISFQHPSLRDLLLMELRDDTAARQRYIQLASPFGVASMIKGIARSDQEIDEKHAVVPRGEQELSLLIDRIKELASGVTQMSDWEQLLAAAESLLPRTQHRDSEYPGLVSLGIRPSELLSARRQKPSEIDLLAFGSSWTGRIVAAIVHSFASPKTFKRNSRGGYPLDSGSPNM